MPKLATPVDIIDLTGPGSSRGPATLLARVAMALGSTLELREVLRRLARIGRDATGARHCSLFLLDGRVLSPAVATGHEPDEETWRQFRDMGPIRLDPRRWSLLSAGRTLALEDAMTSDVIPRTWRERFSPGSAALVPLTSGGEPSGLLVADWAAPRPFCDEELALLDAMGAAAGVAVRNARLYEEARRRSQLQEALVRAAAALVAPLDAGQIADRVAGAFSDLIGAKACVIALLDSERRQITAIAARGPRTIEGRIPVASLPAHVVDRVWRIWEQAKTPIEFGNEPWFDALVGAEELGADWYLLSPLTVRGQTRGCVLLGFGDDRKLVEDERVAMRALSDVVSAALTRTLDAEDRELQMRRLDALSRVNALLTEQADAEAMVGALSELLAGHRVGVRAVAFRDERLVRRLGAEHLTAEERRAHRSGGDWSRISNGEAVVPMYLGRRLYGVLRVAPGDLSADERGFLEVLGRDLAEVAHRHDLRTQIEEAARERAVAAERDRMSVDLHDTAGQVFVAAGLMARDHLENLAEGDPSRRILARIAELADQGKWEIDQAARALAFVPATRRGLVRSLRALAADVAVDSGIRIEVLVDGSRPAIDSLVERSLFRVVHEALANAWRHASCSTVVVELSLGHPMSVRITDDGRGLAEGAREGTGLTSMRRAVAECGGSLDVGPGRHGGASVVATIPVR